MRLPLAFRPKLLDALPGYRREQFARDVTAGVTVGVVALPLAMAFAIASGLKPEAGLFTAIVAGFLISLLGGSRVQIGGPAGAFIVIVYGIVERYGVANLIIATAMSGVMLFLLGLFRLGVLVRFIPVAVVIGFTNGIAVLIALSQLKDFFGLQVGKMPADLFGMVTALWGAAASVNPVAVLVASLSLALIVFWEHARTGWARGSGLLARLALLPGTIVALVLAALAVYLLHLPVETIDSRFGGIPASLPAFTLPAFDWSTVRFLLVPAATLAVLGAIESLLCARVADNLTRERHDPNQELMAQGVANFVAPFLGGMPATGTIARTVTNIKSGGRSPVAGMVHAGHAAGHRARGGAAGRHDSAGLPGGHPALRGLEHGPVEGVRAAAQLPAAVPRHAARRVHADRRARPDGGGRGRPGGGLHHLHLPHLQPVARRAPGWRRGTANWRAPASGVQAFRLYGALFFGAVKLVEDIALHLPRQAVVLDLKNLIYVDSTGASTRCSTCRGAAPTPGCGWWSAGWRTSRARSPSAAAGWR
jgi:SulP family sulfate permease